ncbi:MAG: hypothetical protein IT198_03415 [Acidimicrobiia bacterium]|nr:hypothetical protein [Acidimicrobiia bacterium]
MRGSSSTRPELRRATGLLVTLGVVAALCVGGPAARADEPGGPTSEDFCTAWNAITAAHANGVPGVEITLSNGTVVSADNATVSGASCTAGDAGIEMTGTGLAEAPSGGMSAQSTAPPLAAGQEFLTNVWIDSLQLRWTPTTGITISGVLHLQYSGGLVNLRFSGSFLNPDNWSVSVSSPPAGTYLPVIQSTAVSFGGSFGVTAGTPFFGASAAVSLLQLGAATLENFAFSADLVGSDVSVEMTADLIADSLALAADLSYANTGGVVTFVVDASLELSTSPPSALALSGSLAPDGTLALVGSGDVALGGYGMAGFDLQVTGSPSGPIQVMVGGDFAVTAEDMTVALAGSLTADTAGSVSFDLAGSADFRFGYWNVKSGRFSLTGSQTAAQTMVRFSILAFGFVPVNMAAWFNPDGTYKRVHLPFGLLGYIFFGGAAKSACRCQVTF